MEEFKEDLVILIKNGKYYTDARNWYLSKFVAPFIHKNILIFFIFFCTVSILVCSYFYSDVKSYIPDVPILVSTKDITSHYDLIKQVGEDTDDPQRALENFLVKQYLVKRESYNFDMLEEQSAYMQNSSSPKVFADFQGYMSINNASSPVVLYQKDAIKNVNIESLSYDSAIPNRVEIKFSTAIYSQRVHDNEKLFFLAKIKYETSSIENLIAAKNKSIDFKVVEYSLEQIK